MNRRIINIRKLRRVLSFSFVFLLLLQASQLLAQPVIPGDGGPSVSFVAYAKRNHAATATGFAGLGGDCNDNYLLLAYTGEDIEVMAGLAGSLPGSNHYKIQVYEDGVENTGFYRSSVASGDWELFNFSSPGKKTFKYTDLATPTLVYEIIAIVNRKVTKMWLETEDICAATYPSGQDYKFKVRTEPATLDELLTNRNEIQRGIPRKKWTKS
jgi:hypothetical protein